MGSQTLHTFSEGCGRCHVHFVKQQQTPLPALQEIHERLRGMRSLPGKGNHTVDRDDDTGRTRIRTRELTDEFKLANVVG